MHLILKEYKLQKLCTIIIQTNNEYFNIFRYHRKQLQLQLNIIIKYYHKILFNYHIINKKFRNDNASHSQRA